MLWQVWAWLGMARYIQPTVVLLDAIFLWELSLYKKIKIVSLVIRRYCFPLRIQYFILNYFVAKKHPPSPRKKNHFWQLSKCLGVTGHICWPQPTNNLSLRCYFSLITISMQKIQDTGSFQKYR